MPGPSTGKEALRNIASRRSAPRIRISGGTTIALLGEPSRTPACLGLAVYQKPSGHNRQSHIIYGRKEKGGHYLQQQNVKFNR